MFAHGHLLEWDLTSECSRPLAAGRAEHVPQLGIPCWRAANTKTVVSHVTSGNQGWHDGGSPVAPTALQGINRNQTKTNQNELSAAELCIEVAFRLRPGLVAIIAAAHVDILQIFLTQPCRTSRSKAAH